MWNPAADALAAGFDLIQGQVKHVKDRAVALAILIFSLVYLAGSLKLKVGTLMQPGPGFLPAVFAAALLIISGVNVYNVFKLPQEQEEAGWRSHLVPVGIAATLIVFPFMLETFSYIISSFIVMFFMLWLLRYKSVIGCLLTALAMSVLSHVLFAKLLKVILPSGVLEEFILRL